MRGGRTPATLKVLAIADKAYHGGELEIVDGHEGERGDTLADFVAVEIAEVTEGQLNFKTAAFEAARAMRRAEQELADVAAALEAAAEAERGRS